MHAKNAQRWVIGLLLVGAAAGGVRWQLGPPPPIQEIRLRSSSFFPIQFPIPLHRPGQYRLMSDLVVTDRDDDAIQDGCERAERLFGGRLHGARQW